MMMVNAKDNKPVPFVEFVALMAILTSLAAMSIDGILPALPEIGKSLGVQRENDNQLILTLFFLGMAFGQMIYGPLSDSIGRKPANYIGLGLYMSGALMALAATNFPVMLIGRVMQGIGAAGPRIITVAIIRDQYQGRAMARVMSFVTTVFIMVPIVAPLVGQTILLVAHWRAIFGLYLGLAIIASIWFTLRQPETLAPDRRLPFSVARPAAAIREIFANRLAFGYTITMGLVFGGFIGYLSSAQQIFQEIYGLGKLFPLYFGALAISIGGASFLNGSLVMRYGMRLLSRVALRTFSGFSLIFLIISVIMAGQPPLWSLMTYFFLSFFCVGMLFGNLSALAMETLGHIAGIGAAVIGSLSTLISLFLGTLIGQSYNGTIIPIVSGFAILSITALMVIPWAESGRK